MNSGNLNTANKEREEKAFAGVNSPPSKVYTPKATTVTSTGILFRMKLLNCKNNNRLIHRLELMYRSINESIEGERIQLTIDNATNSA